MTKTLNAKGKPFSWSYTALISVIVNSPYMIYKFQDLLR